MKNLVKRDQGFTLIEIVLVLAIAGLILLMVFLAVSGAQRSRRDTQRKQDLSRIASQLESWASNSGGQYPQSQAQLVTNPASFTKTYLKPNTNWTDPLSGAWYGNNMTYATYVSPAGALGTGTIDYQNGYKCGNNGYMVASANATDYAVSMGLEQGVACRSNDE